MRALIRLAMLYGTDVPHRGPLFLAIAPSGAVTTNTPVSSPPFPAKFHTTDVFRHEQTSSSLHAALIKDLQALSYCDWSLYGTHSFQRGGTQHRLKQGWTPAMVASWGGWSQVQAVTMYKYYYSENDRVDRVLDFELDD